MVGFGTCFGLGMMFSILVSSPANIHNPLASHSGLGYAELTMYYLQLLSQSSFQVHKILSNPASFALPYTLGNLFSVGSTAFLMGPSQQLRSMFAKERWGASVLYILTLAATLLAAVVVRCALVDWQSPVVAKCFVCTPN